MLINDAQDFLFGLAELSMKQHNEVGCVCSLQIIMSAIKVSVAKVRFGEVGSGASLGTDMGLKGFRVTAHNSQVNFLFHSQRLHGSPLPTPSCPAPARAALTSKI